MQDGIKYLGNSGNPASTDFGLWRTGEVKPIAADPQKIGEGELHPDAAEALFTTGQFEPATYYTAEELAAAATAAEKNDPQNDPPQTANATGEGGEGGLSIPLLITNAMRDALKAAGFTDADIDAMTPQQAHEILDAPPAT